MSAQRFTAEFKEKAVQQVTRAWLSVPGVAARFGGLSCSENGQSPALPCLAFIAWAQSYGVRHILIQAGQPMQNGTVRDECLNGHWFETLTQVRSRIASWHQNYNQVRPHSSRGRI